MSATIRKGPVFDPGLCRCCGAIKKCRLLNVEYEFEGKKEVYSDMFMDSFGLMLSHLDGSELERLICATCVLRLRDASAFRVQVLRCEETLLQASIHVHGPGELDNLPPEIKEESDVKDEKALEDDNSYHDDATDPDYVDDIRDDGGTEEIEEKPKRTVKKEKKLKAGVKRRRAKSKHKRDVLGRIRATGDKLKQMEDYDNLPPEIKEESDVKDEKALEDDNSYHDDATDPDYVDDIRDDGGTEEIEEKPKRTVKKEKKLKAGVKRRRAKSKHKRDVLGRIRATRDKLKQMEDYDIQPALEKPKRVVDSDLKVYSNCVALVESSYVCPFDTSFSDYFCVYCRQVFTDPSKLREHTLSHDPVAYKDIVTSVKKLPQIDIQRIDCRLCPMKIDNLEIFKEHINTAHQKQYQPNPSDFLVYKLTMTNLTCTECGTSFGFFHALRKHMAEHFGTCICDVCGAHYFEERMLILHQKTHQRVDENYPCKECGKNFKSKHSRYLHEARTHKKEPAYQCVKCDAVLFSYTLRYRHMIEVHGEERLFPCEHCDRAYDSRKSLREHNRRSHLKIFKHQCDLCDKRFYLPSRLKEHMATHTGERNYRCEYCGKSYPRLRGLKVHMQSHSTEKKFRCVLCNASFTQNVNLKNHMKRQHQSLEMEEFQD